jgi:hypothetical protein
LSPPDKPPDDRDPPTALQRRDDGSGKSEPAAFTAMLDALGNAMQRAAEPEAQAAVQKAQIEGEVHLKAIDATAKAQERRDNHDQERFRWIVGGSYAFGAILLGVSVALIFTDHLRDGLLVISHMVALSVGIMGGRGMSNKRRDEESGGDGT